MQIMPITGMDDFEMRLKRQDAFWNCEVLDRPCVVITIPREREVCSIPEKQHSTFEDRWMDVEFQVQKTVDSVKNTIYMGDALPRVFPNIGPDFFPSLYGGEIFFEDRTSYIKPFLNDWSDAEKLEVSYEHPYWKKMEELYAAYLEVGYNTFYTGWPDLHPGADCLVGIRGPQNMATDLFDEPETVKRMLKKVTADFFQVYDHYYSKLTDARQACTGWPGMVSTRKWHVLSNDFSYMISPGQFDEFFLQGLVDECNHFEACLYHLDGIGSLNHLNSLLGIKPLNAIQWVWGAGHGEVTDWIDIFKKVQSAGKGVQLYNVEPRHLNVLMQELRPEGVWLQMSGIDSEEMGKSVLEKISHWRP